MENKKLKLVEPMVIFIKNLSDVKKEWFLFGFNEFNGKPNFGNDADVRVSCIGYSYDNIFNNTANEGFSIRKMRFQSSTIKNIREYLFLHKNNYITGKYVRIQKNLSICLDAYQNQNDILDISNFDVDSQWKINRKTHLSGIIFPESTIVISIFPEVKNMEVPRLSGKNTSPVIIQTIKAIPNKDIIGGKKLANKKTKK